MLIQHILTERIFRTVFKNPDFTRRNVIAVEIEKVVDALTAQAFSRAEFLRRFDHFYRAIETTAATIEDFTQKQEFLNAVYEKFFQGFSVKVADTHGIVYTPQAVVNFMVRSVEEILRREFGKTLSSKDVHVLDPFVGTGNFLVRVMQEIKRTALPDKYRDELHCNEVMLLPYYIASMNIEHEFYELTGAYEPFEGVCLVDTFELAEAQQISFFTTENTQRVERQKRSPIMVVIGNPPYNVGQLSENDNNKNRKYKVMDKRVAETYAKDSKATNKNALSDPYVKAIRWASDRIGNEGIVAFVTNNGFIDNASFDGMRLHLAQEFDRIYILDLKGNVRKDSMRDGIPIGEAHTVFGLSAMVGIAISFFIKSERVEEPKIFYSEVDWKAKRKEKFDLLEKAKTTYSLDWREIHPDAKHNWLTEGMRDEFETFLSIGNEETKRSSSITTAIFTNYSRGAETTRDDWVYNFNLDELAQNVGVFVETYNEQLYKWRTQSKSNKTIDAFVLYDDRKIKWSSSLKQFLSAKVPAEIDEANFRNSLYRPFTCQYLYFDRILTHRRGQFPSIFPTSATETENRVICLTGSGSEKPFMALVSDRIADLHLTGAGCSTQCFPFYTYNEDGTNRWENITDWALEKFREEYGDSSITKWDIFHYVYGVLHYPVYRERYAANLKRERHHLRPQPRRRPLLHRPPRRPGHHRQRRDAKDRARPARPEDRETVK
ncbi:MAG TPA: type ISP restriction/modification enzyme [Pyrinomonadaceae bacterium]|jgi:predicted helicase